jgi:multiple sugar transport system permease protein
MNEERLKDILKWLGSLFIIGFSLTPFFYMLLMSVSSNPYFLSGQATFDLTLDHYRSVLTVKSLHFVDYLINSLAVSGLSALSSILIAGMAAYSITRMDWPGKTLVLLFVLATSMFPQISLVSYLFKLMGRLDWINTYQALVLPYIAWTLPLSLWILVSYFAQLPRDLDKAALIDGCSRGQALRKVIFPVAAPGLFSATLLAFIFAFNEFLFALMLTTDHRARTVPVGIALFQGLHGETPWGEIMAASTVSVVPLIVLILVFQRNIMQGLTRGAIKG